MNRTSIRSYSLNKRIVRFAMNIHTFKDAVTSKRTALADEVDQDDEDDDERVVAPMRRVVEGEEDEGKEKVVC